MTSRADDVPVAEDPNAIAVVGLACRFGQASSVRDYWRLLLSGSTGIRHWSRGELLEFGHSAATLARRGFVPAGSVLADADAFDEALFGYSPQYAEWLDPQQRQLLELSWSALEDAGFAPTATGLRTGVFASVGQPLPPPVGILDLDAAGMLRFTSMDKDFAATRLSYKLDLTGPSLTVQTACSSSLVAVHMAAESLLDLECDLAVVTAASIHLPQAGYVASRDMILSPSGRCRPFDREADGTVFGNGAGAVVLRRLSDALADGDPVRAVLRGSAVNNDGAGKLDYHAPSPKGQAAVVREAFALSGVDPASVGYVEAHGTGTPLGDPVEFGVLARAFGTTTPCAVGSAKSVVGHLNTAAGLAGMIKAVLALEAGVIPPQTGFADANERIDFGDGALFLPTEPGEWPVDGPRRAAVSSFGIGGTNAHVVLEQAPEPEPARRPATDGPVLVPISANDPDRLTELAGRLADHLAESDLHVRDVAHTLRTGRAALPVRAAVRAHDIAGLVTSLRAIARAEPPEEAAAWIAGAEEPPPGETGRRVRLPGYPFARNRWPMPAPPSAAGRAPAASGLLRDNVSTLGSFRLEGTLDPADPLIAEHRVNGQPVLPAAAQLDGLFDAATRASGHPVSDLRSVVFHRAVRPEEPVTLRGEVDQDGRVRLRSGTTEHAEARLTDPGTGLGQVIDLAEVSARCPHEISQDELYRTFHDRGIDYGPGFQVITGMRVGPDDVLATVRAAPEPGFTVPPRLLDGVLQTVLGFALADDERVVRIPFAIDRISVPPRFPAEARVHLRRAAGRGRIAKFDAVVTDAAGAVVARLDGLALRPVASAASAASWPAAIHLAGWQEVEHVPSGEQPWRGPLILIGDAPADPAAASGPVLRHPMPADPAAAERLGEEAGAACQGVRPLVVVRPGPGPADGHGAMLLSLLRGLARSLGRAGARVVVGCADPVLAAGVAALGRSLVQEDPRLEVLALEAGPVAGSGATTAALPPAHHVRRDDAGRWWTYLLRDRTPGRPEPLIVGGGGYWLHGFGAVAGLLAEHLLRDHRARLVLTGRREQVPELEHLRRIADQSGGSVTYHRLDAADEEQVHAFARRITDSGPPIRGVLHCAAVTQDALMIRSSPEADRAVLAPKLSGAAVLDAATAGWPLDFFLTMSSVSGVVGSQGQTSYAFANGALDRLAAERDRLVERGQRHGRSLSVAWPYWADGGIRIPGDAAEVLAGVGMTPMRTADALAAFGTLASAGTPAPVLLSGDLQRMHAAFPVFGARTAPPVPTSTEGSSPVETKAAVAGRITEVLAEVLRTPAGRIGPDSGFDSLGVDSLMAVRVIDLLEPIFGSLSKTLLFEARTVQELADQLVEDHPDRAAALVAAAAPVTPAPSVEPVAVPAVEPAAPRIQAAAEPPDRAIAIIGIAGRFPDAENLDEFWSNLRTGRDSIIEVPGDRWDAEAVYRAGKPVPGRTMAKWGGFLPDVDKFDARLFHISPREASVIDPQARLFLETCWAVFEDAGYRPDRIVEADELRPRDIGVFVGAMWGEYQLHEAEERMRGNPILADSGYWSIANRASFFFDLQGPSVAVDTACSSALSAIQLACDSLLAGRCAVAIAGGVNVSVHPNKYFMLSDARFGSSDGRCRSFGTGGDGYVPGEGVGAVLLKPLDQAIADGDHVHAVIRGSSANHGGRTNGYTVPNARAQANLVSAALRDAGLSAADIDYVEAHGTGTSLGDPIEIRGLTIAFGRDGVGPEVRVPIGSVKSNVGHLESAAGVVALAKVLLQMRHRTLVPSLHCDPINPEIDFDRVPFEVQRTVGEWSSLRGGPLRAAISSFGAGGANAHLIVEQAPHRPAAEPDAGDPVLVFLSARTDAALGRLATRLADHLAERRAEGRAPALRDVAYVMATGRVELARRAATRATTLDGLIGELRRVGAASQPGDLGAPPSAPAGVTAWLDGAQADLLALSGAERGRRIPLPHYPFERVRCWYDLQIRHVAENPDAVTEPQHRHLRDFGLKRATGPAPAPVPALELIAAGGTALPEIADTVTLRPLPRDPAPASVRTRAAATPAPVTAAPAPVRARVAATPAPVTAAPAPPPVPAAQPAPAPMPGGAELREPFLGELAGVLYLDPGEIAEDGTFAELGVDSVLGVEFVGQLNKRFALDLKATVLYDHPSPGSLLGHVRTLLAAPAPAPTAVPAPPPAARPAAPQDHRAMDVVREQLAGVLYTSPEDIAEDETFQALGVDSVLGVEFVNLINNSLGRREPASVLYDHPTPRRLADHLGGAAPGVRAPAPETAPPTRTPERVETDLDVDALLDALTSGEFTVEQAASALAAQDRS